MELCFWKAEGAQNAQCDGAQFESQAVWKSGISLGDFGGDVRFFGSFFFHFLQKIQEIGEEGIKFKLKCLENNRMLAVLFEKSHGVTAI